MAGSFNVNSINICSYFGIGKLGAGQGFQNIVKTTELYKWNNTFHTKIEGLL